MIAFRASHVQECADVWAYLIALTFVLGWRSREKGQCGTLEFFVTWLEGQGWWLFLFQKWILHLFMGVTTVCNVWLHECPFSIKQKSPTYSNGKKVHCNSVSATIRAFVCLPSCEKYIYAVRIYSYINFGFLECIALVNATPCYLNGIL